MAGPAQLVGHILGHYRILEQIGAGGMGVVYRAHDEQLQRDVALKVLPAGTLADEAARKRFRKEALALAKLNHPNIATIHEFASQEGLDFLVTEYIPGATLDAGLGPGFLPEKQVVRLGLQLAEGLAAAHEQGVVHCDLKPSNLRVSPDGRLKILDFGIAKLLPTGEGAATETLTEAQGITGTLPYMSPEQLRGGPPDARTDIYSAGAVLYEMATGRRPFEAKLSTALTNDIIHRPPSSPRNLTPDLSPTLEYVILKCLEKEPENRYQSAKELAVDLRRLGAPSTTQVVPARVAADKRWVWALAIIGSVAVVTLLLVLLLLNVGWRERLLGRATPSRIESLAVLPLENLSGDPQQEYFADGMTEALITDLSKIGALRVISRTSAMHYKRTSKTLAEIARELRVDGVVEGTVLRSGNRIRITAQLIAAPSDRHLWAGKYERDLRDVFDLQSEVAKAIAEGVRARITSEEQARFAQSRPVNSTPEGLGRAIDFFQQAIGIDTTFALAYVGLADSYLVQGVHAGARSQDIYPKAKAAASKALEIDETLAEAHSSLAYEKDLYEWDWAGAEAEHKRAIELKPNYATAHQWCGIHLEVLGRMPEATAEMRRAQELDPLSLIINANLGQSLYFAGDYDQASEQFRKTLEMDPNFIFARVTLGQVLLKKGRYEEAILQFQTALKLSGNRPNWWLGHLVAAYAKAGRRVEALKILSVIQQVSKQQYVGKDAMAYAYLGLGDNKRALDSLEQAVKDRDVIFLKPNPAFDPLRSDPRFVNILRNMGLRP